MVNSEKNKEYKLASKIKHGNKQAFREFYDLYKNKIYSFSYAYLKSKSESEEIVQIAFIKLWENRDLIKEHLSIKNYLYKITVNHIYNVLKEKKVHGTDFITDENIVFLPDDSTENLILYLNLKEKIDQLVLLLPEQRRKIFELSRFGGLSHNEISERLDISVRTVESQVYKAIKFLKEHLKEELLVLSLFVL